MKKDSIQIQEQELNAYFLNTTTLTDNQLNESLLISDLNNVQQDSINLMQDLNNYSPQSPQQKLDDSHKVPFLCLKSQNQSSYFTNQSTQISMSNEQQDQHEQYDEYKAPKLVKTYSKNKYYNHINQPIHAFSVQYQKFMSQQEIQEQNNRGPWHLDCIKCIQYFGIVLCIIIAANYLFQFLFNLFEGQEQND
ncbi:transmembrane protein, putative (macronuclear) [Tetrahymena thermophila SB210]|uniref:Transmembrane protein, putative n=1 Tax=Tetrahymena thermophila (strain SB210) TaxID=312017 RepID=Q22KN8_TETTS|nr:transmembrane protein, putative [Tetrahymena thermophila SB210]EAR85761.1 transmembrane protein, putative [Tetrahymena thermophila SB210]|eukprot:XP_001033424.1 transmembrane protein, putative [Tetrahymena thermophila SB210]